jgi:hypothetical protein
VDADKLRAAAPYDASTLKVIRLAFDEAWMVVTLSAGSNPMPDDCQMHLAHAVLAHAKAHGHNPDRLREAALAPILPKIKRAF